MPDTPQFYVKPRFSALRNALYFPVDSLNAFQRGEFNDNFGFYQRTFGVYSYMNLTQNLTYRIHYPQGTPLMWQPHNSCAWEPTGTLSMGSMEITPARAKINEELCYDEHFDSTFEAFSQWGQNPEVGMSPAGMDATNALVETIVKNATIGARSSMVGGQLYDLTSVSTEVDNPTRITQAFEKTIGTINGWLKLAIDLAAGGVAHLNDATLITAGNISTDGTTYTGATKTVVELYDENFAAAPVQLQNGLVEGGVGGFNDTTFGLWMVSPSIYRALDLEYKAQKESATINEPRISVDRYTTQTPRGPREIRVFRIDETIVVPVFEVSNFDQYVTGTSHFCYLTMSGVVQMGSSFAGLPVANESEVGVMIERSDRAKDLGTYAFLSHALMGTAINDTNYIAGGYVYAEPA